MVTGIHKINNNGHKSRLAQELMIVVMRMTEFPAPSFRFAFLQLMEQDTWEMFGQSNACFFLYICVVVHNEFA